MLTVFVALVLGLSALVIPEAQRSSQQALTAAAPKLTSNGCPDGQDWNDDVLAVALNVSLDKVRKLHDIRGLTPSEICTMPADKLKRAMVKVDEPKPDQPGEAAKFRAMQQSSDDGQVRPDGLVNALAERAAAIPPFELNVAGIDKNSWTAIGPGNIGGRIRAVLTDPANPNLLLVGSVSGGIWKSTDGGTSWAPINDFMANVAISTLVRDPSNAQRIYAGTGEGVYNGDAIRGFGAFVSNDGGTNWSQLGGTVPDLGIPPAVTQQSDFFLVNRIAVHPTNPAIVLIATSSQYYCDWGGVYRSTNATSANPTWTLVYPHRALDVRFDPNNGNNIIVGEGFHCPPPTYAYDGGAVAWSNNAGASFNRVPLDVTSQRGRVEVAWAPATSGLAVAVTEGNGGSGGDGRFWVSTNAGHTWLFNSKPGHLSGQGWYDNALWVDPTDSKRIVVGGLDIYRGAGAANWWVTNTAVPWTKITQWFTATSVHADHHAIVPATGYNGAGNRVVYFGNDGGLYKSADIAAHDGVNFSANWVNLNNNLPVTQFYGGAGKSGYPGGVTRIVGGTQDNGSLKAPASGTTWTSYFGGDGGFAAIDPVDPNYYYGEYTYGAVHRAATGGSASYIYNGITDVPNGLANFIAPFILDPNNANSMLVGARSLWRSTNVKATPPSWSAVKGPDPTQFNYISAVAVAPGNSDLVWVGHDNGAVYCTINGTAGAPAWTKVTALSPARMVLRIMVDSANSNRVFVTYGGYNPGNVYELTDAMQVCKASPTVTNRHGNLPQAPVRTIVRHATNANWLYVGTEVGVFTTINGGVNWSASNDGPGTVSVDELFWLDNATIVAATHGRGMFQATLGVTPSAPTVTTNAANAVTGTGATLNGTISSNGAMTTASFQFGLTTGYGTNAAATQSPLAANAVAAPVSAAITGLACNTLYHFRAVGANSINTTNGSDANFTTAACGTVPGAPTAATATAGNLTAVVSFTAPASDGGSPITGYTVTSSPAGGVDGHAGTTLTTHAVGSLANGTPYTFTVVATNANGPGPASLPSNSVTPAGGMAPLLAGAATRKLHGGAGTFDLALAATLTNPTTDPRAGPTQSIVFTFDKPVVSGTATVTEGVAIAGTPTFSGTAMTVPLTGVADQQYVRVTVSNVTGADATTGGTGIARVGFLAGDVSQNRVVTLTDIGQVNAQLAQPVTAANYLKDVNGSGTLTLTDKALTNANLTKSLPPP